MCLWKFLSCSRRDVLALCVCQCQTFHQARFRRTRRLPPIPYLPSHPVNSPTYHRPSRSTHCFGCQQFRKLSPLLRLARCGWWQFFPQPNSRAAARVPFPARTMPSPSTTMGFCCPNLTRLALMVSRFLLLCRRALRGSSINFAVSSISILFCTFTISPFHAKTEKLRCQLRKNRQNLRPKPTSLLNLR